MNVTKILILVHSCLVLAFTSISYAKYVPPGPDEIQIAWSGIAMPTGKVILIRRKSDCGAIIFTRFWTEQDRKGDFANRYAEYDIYFQGDGTCTFSKSNVTLVKGKASMLRPRGPFYPLKWQPGDPTVKCGPLKLAWDYYGFVCFFERHDSPGDYGIELAPTPWTNITEVNVLDSRIKWYGFNKDRKTINIKVDSLWNKIGE